MVGVFAVLGNVGGSDYYFNSAIIEIIKAANAIKRTGGENVDKKEIKKRWSEIDMDSKEYRRHEAKIDRAISVISLAAAVVVLGAVLILKYMR